MGTNSTNYIDEFFEDDYDTEWSTDRLAEGGDWAGIQYDNLKNNTTYWNKDEYRRRFPGTTDRDYDRYTELFNIQKHNLQLNQRQSNIGQYFDLMQQYVQSQPGYEAYSKFIPEYLDRMSKFQQGSMDPYTGQLSISQAPQYGQMMDYLGGQMFEGGIDKTYDELGGMYRSVKDEFLPAMDADFEERVQAPMAERLEMLGLSGASKGMEMTAGANRDYSIQRAKAGAQMDMTYAGQLGQVEQARQNAWGQSANMMTGLMGMDEQRQAGNIGREYTNYQVQQNDPFQRMGLGGQAFGMSAGAAGNIGAQGQAFGGGIYEQQSAYNMADADWARMGPLYEMMSQPVSSGGGKK